MWKEFKDFLIKQNAVALAIAVVIGAALNTVVQAIVNDIILPIVQLISPAVAWQEWTWHNFKFGDLASAILNFFIVGFVAWRISKIFVKPAPKGEPTTKICEFCKSTIDVAATRCPHCTSQLIAA
jgi:large conductance mechanosensitive channel